MAHYDCSNCGSIMGIAFGICNNCTPEDYIELEGRKRELCVKADLYAEEQLGVQRRLLVENYLNINGYDEIREKMEEIRERECK